MRGGKNNLSKGGWQKWREKNHMEGMGSEKKNHVTRNKYKVRFFFFSKAMGAWSQVPKS